MKCCSLASTSISAKLQSTVWDNTTLSTPHHTISLLHWSIATIKVCDLEPTEYQRKVEQKKEAENHFLPAFYIVLSFSSLFLFLLLSPLLVHTLLFLFLSASILSFIFCSLILGVFSIFCLLLFYGYNQAICCVAFYCVCVRTRTQAHACQSQQKHCSVLHFITTNHTTSCTQRISMCAIRRGCVSECVLCTHLLPLW